jgi:hypothetical protein
MTDQHLGVPLEAHQERQDGKLVEAISVVPARHLYQCLECGRQFTPTVGTIFNDSHLPLQSLPLLNPPALRSTLTPWLYASRFELGGNK